MSQSVPVKFDKPAVKALGVAAGRGVVVAMAGKFVVEDVVPGAGADGPVAAGNGGSPAGLKGGAAAGMGEDGKTINVVDPNSVPDCVNACTLYVPSS
jgi:hypothetical protein